MGREGSFVDRLLGFPWALLGFFGFLIYSIVALVTGGLAPPDFVSAMTGSGLLAIGHGIHRGAHIVARGHAARHEPASPGAGD